MYKNLIWRVLVGICFAVLMGLLATAVVHAGTPQQAVQAQECVDCHESIQTSWATSPHGQAFSDAVFQEAWEAQGKPQACLPCHTTGFDEATGTYESEGVDCTTCHYPVSVNHPDMVIMPTDISSRRCGECHIDTYADWQNSTHSQENLACIRCHNPHTSEIKKSSAQELCQTCHEDESHMFGDTTHAQEGVLCTDCHLTISETQMGEGHGKRSHTFTVDIATCSECHAQEMHVPTDHALLPGELQTAGMVQPPTDSATVSAQPNPVSPYSFVALAALVGMGFGMVLAPWLRNWYRQASF